MRQGTAVYRLYDTAGTLLYVGVANRPEERWGTHRRKPWWKDVARTEIEWHPTREVALRCEALAVREERPLHNQVIPNLDGSARGVRVREDAPCLEIRRGPRPNSQKRQD